MFERSWDLFGMGLCFPGARSAGFLGGGRVLQRQAREQGGAQDTGAVADLVAEDGGG